MTTSCQSCSSDRAPGFSRCAPCLEKSKAASAKYRASNPDKVKIGNVAFREGRASHGFCRCGVPSNPGRVSCDPCLQDHRASTAARRSRRSDGGLCRACGVPSGGRSHCRFCLDKISDRIRALKYEVFAAYGNICACCGESEKMFLQIDHIAGGGKKDRDAGLFSATWYRWLKRSGFPKDYQLLCANCNWGKHLNGGVCPHQKVLAEAA